MGGRNIGKIQMKANRNVEIEWKGGAEKQNKHLPMVWIDSKKPSDQNL